MQTSLIYPKEKSLFTLLSIFAAIFWLAILVGTMGVALIYALVFFIIYLFAQSGLIAYIKGTAVRITPEQFPALHERIVACASKLGLQPIPEAYLLRHDGVFNAFATKFLGRNYIALYADLVDALESRPEALNFYIGHEIGHLKRKHLTKATWVAPVVWFPLAGAAYSRAREYTCDRHGLACCANASDAAHAIAVLAAGGKHADIIDLDAYSAQATETSGFWMSFHELTGDYPWLVKRLKAVRELGNGREPAMPSRHPLSWLFALFVPRSGVPGGGALVLVMIVAILAAVAIPQFNEYQTKAKVKAFSSDGRNLLTELYAAGSTNEEAKAELAALTRMSTGHAQKFASSNVTVNPNGEIELTAKDAALQGAMLRFQAEPGTDNSVAWHCEVAVEGKLDAALLAWCK